MVGIRSLEQMIALHTSARSPEAGIGSQLKCDLNAIDNMGLLIAYSEHILPN